MKNHKTLVPLILFLIACVLAVWPVKRTAAAEASPPTELWFKFNASTNFNAAFGRLTIQAAYLDFSVDYLVELYSKQTNINGKIKVRVTGPEMKTIATSPQPYATLKQIILSDTNFVSLLLTEKP